MESWRFRRAMYRFMLVSQVFPCHENENEDDEDLDEEDEEEINQTKQGLKRFLDEFFTEELLELQSVVAFLHDLSEWTARAESIYLDGSSLQCHSPVRYCNLIINQHRIMQKLRFPLVLLRFFKPIRTCPHRQCNITS
jgi:hypothetical protein